MIVLQAKEREWGKEVGKVTIQSKIQRIKKIDAELHTYTQKIIKGSFQMVVKFCRCRLMWNIAIQLNLGAITENHRYIFRR